MARDKGKAPAEPAVDVAEEPDPPPSENHRAAMANRALMTRWSYDTRHMFVMEFIQEQQLFVALNAFLKRKIR